MLGTQLGSLARTVPAGNYWAISLAPRYSIQKKHIFFLVRFFKCTLFTSSWSSHLCLFDIAYWHASPQSSRTFRGEPIPTPTISFLDLFTSFVPFCNYLSWCPLIPLFLCWCAYLPQILGCPLPWIESFLHLLPPFCNLTLNFFRETSVTFLILVTGCFSCSELDHDATVQWTPYVSFEVFMEGTSQKEAN